MHSCLECVHKRCSRVHRPTGTDARLALCCSIGTSYVSPPSFTFGELLLWRWHIFFEEALVDDIPCWEVPGHHKGRPITCRRLPYAYLLCILPYHGCEVSRPRGEARLLEVVVLDFTVPPISHFLSCLVVGCPRQVLSTLAATGLWAVLEDSCAGQGL